jgi:hypothetical protein
MVKSVPSDCLREMTLSFTDWTEPLTLATPWEPLMLLDGLVTLAAAELAEMIRAVAGLVVDRVVVKVVAAMLADGVGVLDACFINPAVGSLPERRFLTPAAPPPRQPPTSNAAISTPLNRLVSMSNSLFVAESVNGL